MRASVSGTASKLSDDSSQATTVRQTPSIATESPSRTEGAVCGASIVSRPPSKDVTVPTSCTSPVNTAEPYPGYCWLRPQRGREGVRMRRSLLAAFAALAATTVLGSIGLAGTSADPAGTMILNGQKAFPIVLAKGPDPGHEVACGRRRVRRGRRRGRDVPQGRPADGSLDGRPTSRTPGSRTRRPPRRGVDLGQPEHRLPGDSGLGRRRAARARGRLADPGRERRGGVGVWKGARRAALGRHPRPAHCSSPTAARPAAVARAGAQASRCSTPTTTG